jgi:Lysozyme like domain
MSRLSAAQIGGYAAGAGFSGKALTISTAVALAESGGNTQATGPVFGEKGLWQVYPRAHPDWDRGGNLYDPAYNAKAAFAISNGGKNWMPWTTYTHGTYLLFMPQAEGAAQHIQPVKNLGGKVAGVTGSVQAANPLNSLTALSTGVSDLEKAGKFISSKNFWVRVAEFVIGGALVVGGINIIAKPVTKPVVDTAVKAAAVIPK